LPSKNSVRLFLTGADTNVGKTYVAVRLVRALRAAGRDCVGMKPICCGARSDAELLHAASDAAIPLDDVNPVWLRAPTAPLIAAMVENRTIDLAIIRETFARLSAGNRPIIVEGVGGWRVPIAREFFVSDLAAEMRLPVAVVVANRLGAVNHTLLTVESIRAMGLECAGIILNQAASAGVGEGIAIRTNRAILEEIAGVPVLFEVAHGQEAVEVPRSSTAI
jgi:dethiobiotin synthetase